MAGFLKFNPVTGEKDIISRQRLLEELKPYYKDPEKIVRDLENGKYSSISTGFVAYYTRGGYEKIRGAE